eukprot:8952243-Lingulodinium_polyedra.AAC.1
MVARERVDVVRAAAPGIVIWLGKGTVEMQCEFQCVTRTTKGEGCWVMVPVRSPTVPAVRFQVPYAMHF